MLSTGSAVSSAGSTRAARATEGSARSIGAAEGSAGSTRAGRVEGDTDLEGVAIELVDDATVASLSIPGVN